jgi:hypothetical protein
MHNVSTDAAGNANAGPVNQNEGISPEIQKLLDSGQAFTNVSQVVYAFLPFPSSFSSYFSSPF